MTVREISPTQKELFNQKVNHIIQSWQWGEFRKKEGKRLHRLGLFENEQLLAGFQFTLHKIPFFSWTIGYLPRCTLPNNEVMTALINLGKKAGLVFIKIEPQFRVEECAGADFKKFAAHPAVVKSKKPIFATNTFLIDLNLDETVLLAKMHPKTRYNIRLAQRSQVVVEEKNDDRSFNIFLKLQRQTAKKQGFYIHPDSYYRLMWETLKPEKMAHLLIASYKKQPLVAWILFRFKDTIYYPYGGSSERYKELMASNLIVWEVIRLGKRLGCKAFDFWGALGKDAKPTDPWYGFHRFKAGYGGELASFVGAYDLVIDPVKYQLVAAADKLRWLALRLISQLRKVS